MVTWCQVLRGAAHSPGQACHSPGESEVCDDDVALPVQQDVLRLEVPVDHVHAVQVGEARHDLGRVECDAGAGESLAHPHQGEQLPPAVVGEEKVEIVFVLPAVNEGNQKWIFYFLNQRRINFISQFKGFYDLQDFSLIFYMLFLFVSDDLIDWKYFQCLIFLMIFMLTEEDSRKRSWNQKNLICNFILTDFVFISI